MKTKSLVIELLYANRQMERQEMDGTTISITNFFLPARKN